MAFGLDKNRSNGAASQDALPTLEALEPRLLLDGAFAVTMTPIYTYQTRSWFQGTVEDIDGDRAILEITISNTEGYSATYAEEPGGLVNNNDGTIDDLGTWEMTWGHITALAPGDYDVAITATRAGDNIATDDTTDELHIDLTIPDATVDLLVTNDTSPELTGTFEDNYPGMNIVVSIEGIDYDAANNKNITEGTWTLSAGDIDDLDDGTYDIILDVHDKAGNPLFTTFNNMLTIDTKDPVVDFQDPTPFPMVTNNRRPAFSGALDEPGATVEVTISNGAGYSITYTSDEALDGIIQIGGVGADSVWLITEVTDPLDLGDYDVLVTATDEAGNQGTATLAGDLSIVPGGLPIIRMGDIVTNDTTPELTGMVLDADDPATLEITISNGEGYSATYTVDDGLLNNLNETWTLPGAEIDPAMEDGTYDVELKATNDEGEDTYTAVGALIIDTVAPIVTVDTIHILPGSPALTGTVDEDLDVSIVVNIDTIDYDEDDGLTIDEDGNWTLPAGIIPDLADATDYDVVVTATDEAGNIGIVTEVDAVVVSVIPYVTVDTTITNDTRPELNGTVNDPDATVTVEIWQSGPGGARVLDVATAATNNLDGTWTLADNAIPLDTLDDGTYEIRVEADNAGDVGNVGNGTGELIIEQVPPVVTAEDLVTGDTTPGLNGTVVEDLDVSIAVTISKAGYAATYTSDDDDVTIDGINWMIADDVIAALAPGSYVVDVVATDEAGNVGEIAADLHIVFAPIVTIDDLTTDDQTPQLTGMVYDLPGNRATVRVTLVRVSGMIDMGTYVANNNGDNTWTLADGQISTALNHGTYAVDVVAINSDGTSVPMGGILEIDLFAPLVTVESLKTVDATPELTGTVDDTDATIIVELWQEELILGWAEDVNNGDGTWSLADDKIDPALAEGTYTIKVIATDEVGRVTTANGTLEINLTPDVTIDYLETNDTTPQLTGTVNDPDAEIAVEIVGENGLKSYEADNNGDGTWTLDDDEIANGDLVEGDYDVTVKATNGVHVGTDTGELVIETTAPAITVDDPFGGEASSDRRPAITGTVDDADATVTITIDGTAYTAVVDEVANGGLFGWTVEAETIPAPGLTNGTYTVSVSASDELGNIATDDTVRLTVAYLPTITVDELVTSEVSPELTGTVEDAGDPATILVTINGNEYTAQRYNDGTWALDTIAPFVLADDGVYDIIAEATNNAGTAVDDTTGELTIDRTAPIVTVDAMTTTNRTPTITGTVSDPEAEIEVTINNKTYDVEDGLVINADGTWELPTGIISPALSEGQTYDIVVTATDAANNEGVDATYNELTVVDYHPVNMRKKSLRRLRFWDTDGTLVKIAIKDSRQLGSITIYLGSDSPITDTAGHYSKALLESDTGIWISRIHINGINKIEGLVVKTKGGTVKGTTIGMITGTGVLSNLSAMMSELQGVSMVNGMIHNIRVRNLTGMIYMGATDNKAIKMTISEQVRYASIIITGTNISSFTAGSMINSSLFVGVTGPQDLLGVDGKDNVFDLPNVIDLQDGFSIGKVNIKGYRGAEGFLFENSNIAAWKIKSVKFKDPRLNNGTTPFGITATTINQGPKLSFKLGKTNHRFKDGIWSPADLGVSDLEVRLV